MIGEDSDYLKERGLLLGQVAEARAREKRVLALNRNLKILLFLSLVLLPISHCWFGKTENAQISEKNRAVLMNFREAQLNANFKLLQHLTNPDSTFTYITQEGDNAVVLSQQFYGNPRYAYMILMDNQIKNARVLSPNDTLVLRFRPEVIEKNQYLESR
jgi:nucleoid-associated protein YgaU